jgi:hypothetical protein
VSRATVRPISPRRLATGQWNILLVVTTAASLYVVSPPRVPDLAAQVARARLAHGGTFFFWTGWFGGVNLPSYSPLAPLVMSWLGVGVTAAISVVAATVAARWLFHGSRRPRLGLAVFSAGAFVDIVCGRVTFALGFAVAIVALALLSSRRGAGAVAAGVAACLASPLAGLFLGLMALAVAGADRSRRSSALILAAVLAAVGVLLGRVSPGTGQMPYPLWHMVVSVATLVLLAAICPQPLVRWGCGVVGLASVGFFAFPEAVGTNIVRLEWLAAAPIAIACADLRRARLVMAVGAAVIWPLTDLGVQLADAATPAASPAFYAPLLAELHTQVQRAGSGGAGERVEVVDPASQWSAAYVAPSFPLARGWDRQVDRADNPLFYSGTLTARTYHSWLSGLAVGWVALPRTARIDYASVAEASLVQRDPHYLQPVWQNPNWRLYRVVDAHPLIRGATTTSVSSDGVTFDAANAGVVGLQLRWSPYLTLTANEEIIPACISARGAWTTIALTRPGTYTLTARLVVDRPDTQNACSASDLSSVSSSPLLQSENGRSASDGRRPAACGASLNSRGSSPPARRC